MFFFGFGLWSLKPTVDFIVFCRQDFPLIIIKGYYDSNLLGTFFYFLLQNNTFSVLLKNGDEKGPSIW
jgi:hypothetical protein